ncbi:MAG: methyltransferase domain-containing protein [Gammaproteobacteria bacterium]|nr:methyltransferase domain-containing protein [Gammaproteobacteria bacterium]
MKHVISSFIIFSVLFSGVLKAESVEAKLDTAANGSHRSDKNKARNKFRHPVQTLSFFGIKDDVTVVEISPGGGGWYTEVLAPFLRENGKFYAASFNKDSKIEYYRKNAQKFLDKLAANPEVYDKVMVTEFEIGSKEMLEPAGQADLVVTFRNTHNWLNNDIAEATFMAIHKVLKKGGTLGLVQHRGSEEMTGKEWSKKGYVSEKEVIRLAEAAGFELIDKSEVNANPKDTKDYADGVWTLPPVYRLKDQDREKYTAIGESDRMTLKFIKL